LNWRNTKTRKGVIENEKKKKTKKKKKKKKRERKKKKHVLDSLCMGEKFSDF
jgi:hypothetical protein